MAESGHGRRSLNLQLAELTMDDFTIDDHWLEVAHLVLKLTFLILAAEVIDAFLNGVTLYKMEQLEIRFVILTLP